MEEEIREKKILFWREFVVSQMNNLAVFPLLMGVLALLSKDVSIALFLWIPMGFVPFIFYLLRIRIDHFLLLLLTHILIVLAVGGVYWFTPCRDMCIVAAVCYLIYSMIVNIRTFDQLDGHISVIVATGLAVIVSLVIAVDVQTAFGSFDKMIAVSLILYFGLYFFSGYIEKYCNFLVVSKNGAGHIPKDEIFRSGAQMALGSIAVIIFLLFLVADIGFIRTLIRAVRNLLFSLLSFLFGLLYNGREETEPVYFLEDPGTARSMFPPASDGNYHGFFWEFLTLLASVLVTIAFVSFLVYALKRVLKFFLQRSKREKIHLTETEDEDTEDIRESCKTEHGKTGISFPELKPVFLLTPNEKIRRFYRHFVNRNKELLKPAEASFLTAKECTHILERDRMAEIYEKARYSGEECTNLDYSIIRELSRRNFS